MSLEDVARQILVGNLGLDVTEKYLFFTDSGSPWENRHAELLTARSFLHEFYEAFCGLRDEFPNCLHGKYESTGRHGGEPGEDIWRLGLGSGFYDELLRRDLVWKLRGEVALANEEQRDLVRLSEEYQDDIVSCVVAFPWYSVTHTRFRKIINDAGGRFVSIPMLTRGIAEGPLKTDWDELATIVRRVYEVLLQSELLRLTCPRGTNLVVNLGEREQVHEDNGIYRTPGSFGNLPAGEVYFVPKEESAEGLVVFSSAPGLANIEPTQVLIESGKVSCFKMETEYSRFLDAKFQHDFCMRHVAEFGIGTNPRASDPGSLTEGEKIRGTVHVALGDDSTIGGRNEAIEHLDHVIRDVTLEARLKSGESRMIIQAGNLLL